MHINHGHVVFNRKKPVYVRAISLAPQMPSRVIYVLLHLVEPLGGKPPTHVRFHQVLAISQRGTMVESISYMIVVKSVAVSMDRLMVLGDTFQQSCRHLPFRNHLGVVTLVDLNASVRRSVQLSAKLLANLHENAPKEVSSAPVSSVPPFGIVGAYADSPFAVIR